MVSTSPQPQIHLSFKSSFTATTPGAACGSNTGLCAELQHYYTHGRFKEPPEGAPALTQQPSQAYVPLLPS